MSWVERFAELADLDERDKGYLVEHARIVTLPAGQPVFAPGARPEAFLFVLDGTVLVRQMSPGGREIVLYRVSGGESCIMTTACLLSDEEYLAEGITETEVRAVALARADFDALMDVSHAFRRLVFARYASRLTRLMEVVEDVVFERLDRRLARKLLEFANESDSMSLTHQALAVELGSAREVISRHLKTFSERGWIEASRGMIEIRDREGLETYVRDA